MAAVPIVSFYAKVKPDAIDALLGMLRSCCRGEEEQADLAEILLRSAISATDRNAAASGASGAAREANRVTSVQDHKERLLSASTRAVLQECRLQRDGLGRHVMISEEGLTDTLTLNVDNLAKPRKRDERQSAPLRCLRGCRVTRSAVSASQSPVDFLRCLRFEPVLQVVRKGYLFRHGQATLLLFEESGCSSEGLPGGAPEEELEPSAKRLRAGTAGAAQAERPHNWLLEVQVAGEPEQEENRAVWTALFSDADKWADALLPHVVLEPFRVREALAMLDALGRRTDALMATRLLLPQLEYLKLDPWWEVQAQLLRLCCALLVRCPQEELPEQRDALIWSQLRDSLLVLLQSRAPAMQCFVLSESAPLLKLPTAFPELGAPFVRCLLSLPPAERAAVLSRDKGGLSVVPGVGAGLGLATDEYTLTPLPRSWDALTVARELMAVAKAQKVWDPPKMEKRNAGKSRADQRAEEAMGTAATKKLDQLKAVHADVLFAVLAPAQIRESAPQAAVVAHRIHGALAPVAAWQAVAVCC